MADSSGGGLIGLAIVMGVVMTVVWFFLPFAVFGIKKRLDETNRLLRLMIERGGGHRVDPTPPPATGLAAWVDYKAAHSADPRPGAGDGSETGRAGLSPLERMGQALGRMGREAGLNGPALAGVLGIWFVFTALVIYWVR